MTKTYLQVTIICHSQIQSVIQTLVHYFFLGRGQLCEKNIQVVEVYSTVTHGKKTTDYSTACTGNTGTKLVQMYHLTSENCQKSYCKKWTSPNTCVLNHASTSGWTSGTFVHWYCLAESTL